MAATIIDEVGELCPLNRPFVTFQERVLPMTSEPRASLATEFEGDVRKVTDNLLTLAARSGNGCVFVELGQRHSKKIKLHVYRILGNWEDAEDVVQESLLIAFKHLNQFRGTAVLIVAHENCNQFSTYVATEEAKALRDFMR